MANKLYVGSLSYDTTEDTLKDTFAQAGTVQSATIIIDRMSNRSKGFGFVEMSTDEEGRAAIAGMAGKERSAVPLFCAVVSPVFTCRSLSLISMSSRAFPSPLFQTMGAQTMCQGSRKRRPSPASRETWRPGMSGLSSITGVSLPVFLSTSTTSPGAASNSTVGQAV